ncbi:MAG: V-type ATPase subunit, partial [Candidatus Lokiarchaeota archaeon]
MSIMVPSYAYTYIKIGFLKELIMEEEELKQLDSIMNIEDLINQITPFFPDIKINEYTIEEIEKSLFHVYIKLLGRILSVSPENMRDFLRNYLLKYEIINIKQIILGSILGLSKEEKRSNVNFLVEEYLEKKEFIENLLNITNLDEIQLYMRDTMYNEVIREGITYFRNNNEVFVLEAFLDNFYYLNLLTGQGSFEKYEKEVITSYIFMSTEIYNLNVLYRGIINSIDKKLLAQFIVDNTFLLKESTLYVLLEQSNLDEFFRIFNQQLSQKGLLRGLFKPVKKDSEDPIWEIEDLYTNYFFQKFKFHYEELEYMTIFKILEILIK